MNAEVILRIAAIFEQNGWTTEPDENSSIPDLFERFCRMCARLTVEQRELILDLTRDYTWLREGSEYHLFLSAWRTLLRGAGPSIRSVVVAPLYGKDSKRPKSADGLYYSVATRMAPNLTSSLGSRPLFFCKSYTDISRHVAQGSTLVLVDDYVGTGNSAIKALGHLHEVCPAARSMTLCVVALAAQRQSIAALQAQKCALFAHHIFTRGISDNAAIADVKLALSIMDDIGNMLGVQPELHRGHGGAEALVSLTRTPNNTFPVFWTNKKVGGVVWDSPFPR